jgi:hypothetical protein
MHQPRRLTRRLGSGFASLILAFTAVAVPIAVPTVLAAADPDHITFTLEGCNLSHGATFDPVTVTCSDAGYTTGNLGKVWNELDLVPHRMTLQNGAGTQTYSFIIAGDYKNGAGTAFGWDFISAAVTKNAALSSASCPTNPTVGPLTITPAGSGVGGADQTIYRLVTITQAAGSTCVYDYYQRLAIGAHLFSGSSLQSNLWNQSLGSSGIGQKRIQLPVNEIEPQSIEKDMSAVQDVDFIWDVTKQASPASVNFGDTCDASTPLTANVSVTVTWTKSAPTGGPITITTHVYATNPAHRTITVAVTDNIYAGSDQSTLINSASVSGVDVPANTTMLVLTHTTSVASGTEFNDVATATYTDKVTGIPVPGTTTASASATVQTGSSSNETAVVTDAESITGTALDFKVTGSTGASGTFVPAVNDFTTSSAWTSGTQSAGGSVTINKTVRVTSATSTSGTLSDTATLTTSGSVTHTANASISVSSSRNVSIVIDKTIPNVLTGAETASFTFDIKTGGENGTVVDTKTITFTAGQTHKTATASGLAAGTAYTVVEQPATNWTAQPSQTVTINPGSVATCTSTVNFENSFGPASARVRKVTDPAGGEAGWSFKLHRVGADPLTDETVITTDANYIAFTTTLVDGASYTITETGKTGYDFTSKSAACDFTVNFPADAGRTFSCSYTNTKRGQARVVKTVSGAAPTGTQSFTFQLRQGAVAAYPGGEGTILESANATAANGGVINFSTLLVPGTTYQLCEVIMPGWLTSLQGAFVPNSIGNPTVDNSPLCVNFTVAAGETKTFNVDNTPPPGGRALTIGFWKNWASCASSSGKQNPVLDQTLALAGGHILIGDLDVDTCLEAVRILNKSTVNTAKKMSSDPAFNLAAQLLAAKLNLVAGAGTCPAATNAINQAQTELAALDFNGITHLTISKTKATLLNSLANTIDRYNNNVLC